MATTTIGGFVGSVKINLQSTRYGLRTVTIVTIGIKSKQQTTWQYVKIWGSPDLKTGDVISLNCTKYGNTQYGKIVDHQARNKRDRREYRAVESVLPKQLSLPLF